MGKKFFPVISFLILGILACSLPGAFSPSVATYTPFVLGGPSDTPDLAGATPGTTDGSPVETPVSTESILPPPPRVPVLQVAYGKGGNLWLWTETGSSVQLTSSGSDTTPRISPDGQQIAFLRGEELWAINSDGSNLRPMVNNAYLTSLVPPATGRGVIHWFSWQPFSHNIYFGTSSAGEAYTVPVYDLHMVAADGGTAPSIKKTADMGGMATFSPDGTKLTLAQPTRILLMNTDGSNYHAAITYDVVQTYSEWNYIPEVVWFSDSSEFRTVIPASDPLGDPLAGTTFWSVPVSGSPMDMAGFISVPAFQGAPRISPDGLNVAYLSPSGDNSELHLNGFYIGDVLYSSYPANQWDLVGWAPDSNGFVYWTDDTRNLWFGHTGSAAVRLTDTPHAEGLRWIDLTRILFASDSELRLGAPGGASVLIDTDLTGDFDFSNN
jgi:hypothetical protein